MFDTVRHRPSGPNVGRSAKLVLTAAAVFTLLAGGTALATTSTASGNDTHQVSAVAHEKDNAGFRNHGAAVSKAAHECPKGSDTAAGAAKGAEKSAAAQAKRAAKSAARAARGKG